jgi:hypothetical protein
MRPPVVPVNVSGPAFGCAIVQRQVRKRGTIHRRRKRKRGVSASRARGAGGSETAGGSVVVGDPIVVVVTSTGSFGAPGVRWPSVGKLALTASRS